MIRYRPTWVDISKRAFTGNVRKIKKKIGRSVQLLAVLKADAYGHGADGLAPLAVQAGATRIGVSSLEEGLALRQAGVLAPILLLGGIYPFKNFSVALEARLTPTVASFEAARQLRLAAQRIQRPAVFHLKVDTGMGRIGVSLEEAKTILTWVAESKGLCLEGIYTHFSTADTHPGFTQKQLNRFRKIMAHSRNVLLSRPLFHAANSAALLRTKSTHLDMVRPGLALYGVSPFETAEKAAFSPVLSWQTKVIFLKKVPKGTPISYGRTFVTKRPSVIATLPVGYADGMPRLASNKGAVLIRGQQCPVVGRVTMDHIMVDVTRRRVEIGDTATLIGQQGRQTITARDWAQWSQTNAYEICCGISKRVPRVLTP